MTDYIVRAALHEETNNGWVWVCGPSQKDLQSRTVVKITRPGHCRGVYTEIRTIESNFLGQYNHDPDKTRIPIQQSRDTVVVAEWYRAGLAIWETTQCDDKTGTVPLRLKIVRLWGYRSLCFACHHPDPTIRLATRLGMLGIWLGLLALADPLLKVYEHFDGRYDRLRLLTDLIDPSGTTDYLHAWAMLIIALLFGGLGVWACWGRPRPRRN